MVAPSLAEEISNAQPIYDNRLSQELQTQAKELSDRMNRLEQSQYELHTSMKARLEFLRTELTRLQERQALWASAVEDEEMNGYRENLEDPAEEIETFDEEVSQDQNQMTEGDEAKPKVCDMTKLVGVTPESLG